MKVGRRGGGQARALKRGSSAEDERKAINILVHNKKCPIGPYINARERSVWYTNTRGIFGLRIELTEVSGTGIEKLLSLPKCRVPVSKKYRTTVVFGRVSSPVPSKYWYSGSRSRVYWYPGYVWVGVLTDVSGTCIEKVSNSPNCRVSVSRSTEQNIGTPRCRGWGYTTVVPGVYFGWAYRSYRIIGGRYRVVPNTPEWFGRGFTEQISLDISI